MNALGLTRPVAESLAGTLPGSRIWKPVQWTLTREGVPLLVKDVRYSPSPYRFTVGRLLLGVEERMYRRLEGLPFVPRFFGRLDEDALVLERVDARPLNLVSPEDLDPAFYDRLGECVDRMHERGVVHLDIRHRGNILVTRDGRPVLIDFANSLYLGGNPVSRKILVPLLGQIDHSGVLKYKMRDFPDRMTEADRLRYGRIERLRFLWPFDRLRRILRRLPGFRKE